MIAKIKPLWECRTTFPGLGRVSGEAYERMGLDPELVKETLRGSDELKEFRSMLFAQIVPNMKKIGLLEGWLEERFAEMEVLHFKDYDSDAVLESLIQGADAPLPAKAG